MSVTEDLFEYLEQWSNFEATKFTAKVDQPIKHK